MLNGGEIIKVNGKYFLFCGYKKNFVMRDIVKHMKEEYYIVSKFLNNETMLHGAINNMIIQSISILELNENMELDENSNKGRRRLFFDVFDDTIVVKKVDLKETLAVWQLKRQLLNSAVRDLPELLTTEEVLDIIDQREQSNEHKSVIETKIIKEFFLDVLHLYKATAYYELVYKTFSPFIGNGKQLNFERTNHVFRNNSLNQFYFVSNRTSVNVYAVTNIDDIDGTVHALAQRGKLFFKFDNTGVEKVL